MTVARRLSVCYLVPGHDFVSSSGPTRNVLNLARALGQRADVTIAFHRLADCERPADVPLLEIDPGGGAATIDDAAMRGAGYLAYFRYLRQLHRFADQQLRNFDVVLEKSWLLSGYVSAICAGRGQLGVPIENIVPNSHHAGRQSFGKFLRLKVGRAIAGGKLRRTPLVIAETEFLKREIATFWRVQAERIAVVDLGVDRTLFAPRDQGEARRRLGMRDKLVMTYVGVMDATHDLEPVIRGLQQFVDTTVELHLIGDGNRRAEYAALAAGDARIVFHGRVAHHEVPWHIAAADLCLAPYDATAFSSGELGYSTMKIPEYLSVGRPVVSVPSGRIRQLLNEGDTGFLFSNDVAAWLSFFRRLPTREQLHAMGLKAAATRLSSWDDTASAYLALCERELERLAACRS